MKFQHIAYGFVGTLLAVMIAGPTPGSVGSCSDSVTFANAPQFCADKKYWTAQRAYARGEQTLEQTQTEINGISAFCASAVFVDCTPTQLAADACVEALKDMGRLSEATDAIPECTADSLCPNGATTALVDEGARP